MYILIYNMSSIDRHEEHGTNSALNICILLIWIYLESLSNYSLRWCQDWRLVQEASPDYVSINDLPNDMGSVPPTQKTTSSLILVGS